MDQKIKPKKIIYENKKKYMLQMLTSQHEVTFVEYYYGCRHP